MKATKKQLQLFSTRGECALWLQLPEAQQADVVNQYTRLIARAAKVAPACTGTKKGRSDNDLQEQ